MINGEKIKALMNAKGITNRQLATKVGVSEAMMSYILSGLRDTNVQCLVRIAAELECSVDEIILK